MKVSIGWLKQLVDLKVSMEQLVTLIPMRTIGLKETTKDFIELDMKGYNRADLLSMRGVARDIAAITDSKTNFSDKNPKDYTWVGKNLPEVKIQIENKELCPVYCVAKIEGLKVGKSPNDVVKKLADSGIRSIDNITDITNLLMMEYGQTIHSFDATKVADETMIIKLAKKGEQFTTLDGKNRVLTDEDLLIADPKKILSLSGIMGGKDSEITESTNTILLEVAIFDPVSIRKTSQRFNLYSEASKRIQHGLTKTNLLQTLDTAIRMYQQLGGKLTAISLVGDLTDVLRKVKLTRKKLNSLVGIDFTAEQVEEYLKKLGFTLASQGETLCAWEVTVPYWRLDINIEEDLIEEVARMYGYEKIPPQKLRGKLPPKIDQRLFNLIYDLKSALVKVGLTEVQTYSFYSTDVLNNLDWDKQSLVMVANPISTETEYLREDLWPNLLEVAAKNIKHGFKDVAIFEVGKVYLPQKSDLPKEPYRLSIALCNGGENPSLELYQIFQKALKHLAGEKMQLHLRGGGKGLYENKYFHPKRFAFLDHKDQPIGGVAEVHQRFSDKFGIEKRVAVLEIELT